MLWYIVGSLSSQKFLHSLGIVEIMRPFEFDDFHICCCRIMVLCKEKKIGIFSHV